MRDGPRADLCERMLAGQLDLALLVESPELHERLHRYRLFSERYVMIFPPGHRFETHAAVSVDDLTEECLLLHEDVACPARRFISDAWTRNNTAPRRQHFANSQAQLLEMVHADLGVSVAGERLPAATPLLRRPIDVTSDARIVMLATVAGRPMGPTPSLFSKLLRGRAWSADMPAAAEAA